MSENQIKLLNVNELNAQINLNSLVDSGILIRGSKTSIPRNTPEERAKMKSYQDDLRQVLSLERVALRNDRSIATIEDGKIKLIKRHGKWDVFETNGSYLEPHVALLLIELNRLEVYLGKMVVSLECAYHMFLTHEITSEYSNNTEKLTKCEYLVYSHFKRFGCNIRRFKNDSTSLSSQGNAKDVDESSQLDKTHLKDYIWNHLYELLGHRKSVISGKVNDNRSSDIKLAMNTTIQKFKHNACIQTDPRSDITETCKKNIGHKKRQCSNASDSDVPVTKSVKLAHTSDYQYFGSGSTNDFMVGNVFLQFKNIFSKVDYIDVRKPYSYDNQKKINERFSFDLWDSLDKQCQSTGADYRLIIKPPSKLLPHNDDIFKLYDSLIHKSSIVLICANVDMSFQAYIYRFTT